MQNRKIRAVCCKDRSDYKDKLYGENPQLLVFNWAVHIQALGFKGLTRISFSRTSKQVFDLQTLKRFRQHIRRKAKYRS